MLNPTSTEIVSPKPYVSPLPGLLAIDAEFTEGAVAVAPFTLWPAAAEIA